MKKHEGSQMKLHMEILDPFDMNRTPDFFQETKGGAYVFLLWQFLVIFLIFAFFFRKGSCMHPWLTTFTDK